MSEAKLISLNVGLPREVNWKGRTATTGIFKEPVTGPVMLRTLNLDGDRQADLSVHGGVSKAVYAYPAEHYQFWKTELPEKKLPYGMFGENLTTEGLSESSVHVGDRFRVGAAEIMVTEPRLPCYKLGLKFDDPEILRRFLVSRRTGFYFAVIKEGMVEAGDPIMMLSRDENEISVADITRLYAFEKDDVNLLERVARLPALSESWRGYFVSHLEKLGSGGLS
jgi:MOSC domain-containing protein YiiM